MDLENVEISYLDLPIRCTLIGTTMTSYIKWFPSVFDKGAQEAYILASFSCRKVAAWSKPDMGILDLEMSLISAVGRFC